MAFPVPVDVVDRTGFTRQTEREFFSNFFLDDTNSWLRSTSFQTLPSLSILLLLSRAFQQNPMFSKVRMRASVM